MKIRILVINVSITKCVEKRLDSIIRYMTWLSKSLKDEFTTGVTFWIIVYNFKNLYGDLNVFLHPYINQTIKIPSRDNERHFI